MKYIKLFEEFETGTETSSGVNTSEINQPCTDCDMVAKQIKNEIKKINRITARKKQTV